MGGVRWQHVRIKGELLWGEAHKGAWKTKPFKLGSSSQHIRPPVAVISHAMAFKLVGGTCCYADCLLLTFIDDLSCYYSSVATATPRSHDVHNHEGKSNLTPGLGVGVSGQKR